jgi:uncharacterized RDD family membrane protein YckC
MRQTSAMTGLVSGEGVAIELSRAGLGSRAVAAVIDLAVELVALLVFTIFDGIFASGDPDIMQALTLVEVVLVLAGYPILFEWLSHGRTLGKLAMGIRVVRDDGGPIGFRQALVRGLSGFLLEKPGLFLVGIFVAVPMIGATESHKRIGDHLAGTFVLNERSGPGTALQVANWYVPPALYGWAQSLDLSGVDDQLALHVRQFVLRAAAMTAPARSMLEAQFANRLLQVTSPPPPPGVPAALILTTVLAERRRRAESSTRPQPNYPTSVAAPIAPPPQWAVSWPPAGTSAPPPQRSDASNPFTPPA